MQALRPEIIIRLEYVKLCKKKKKTLQTMLKLYFNMFDWNFFFFLLYVNIIYLYYLRNHVFF